MLGKFVLWATGLGFFLYGIACLYSPDIPAGYIGYVMTNADAVVEVSGMYGGLQTGFGLWCIFGALNQGYSRAALLSIVFSIGALAIGRVVGLSQVVGDAGGYTYGAIVYESITALLALVSLRRNVE